MLNPHLPSPEEFATLSPEALAARLSALPGTLGERLGIRFTHVARDRVDAVMPVDGNRQPAGRLHGGANIALAEELASVGSWANLDVTRQVAVGVDINATHVRGVTGGEVNASARLAYRGRTVMVWEIEVRDERGKLTCLARCTCNVINR
ncbi:PaaI family thioesterase [Deinococcus maricopensis]|uniref:Phenylacetic acid degradation-related protein n=1 Tax=Deinococcus maricopensis (strain DSM 21211 / LMG 22137 / NRRL B-23946 / LB-34) TaxID=709986 RepID=E8U4Y6_DEIML|nr:hotdog fold thioesterase [Deinococcus maricopensis]ADV66125.1 phenylacetic acid degradation-related protein [Deinococcus maricopensis DSM 21211]